MLKYFLLLIFPGLLSLLSCGQNCRFVDCGLGDIITVQYLSRVDSANLYKAGNFHMDSLKVWVIERPDSLPVAIDLHYDPQFPQNVFSIETFSPRITGFIFSPRAGLTDTLLVSLRSGEESKCCGVPILFSSGVLNGDTIHFSEPSKILRIFK